MDKLMERLQKALSDAKAALDAAVVETDATKRAELKEAATKARQEVEHVKSLIDDQKQLDELAKNYAPIRPVLPNTGDGAVPLVNGSVKTDTSSQDEPNGPPDRKAAWVTRFGNTEKMTDQILTELHGKDFEAAYWNQKSAFRKYLRSGDERLNEADRTALRQLVMTPASVKMALNQGVDDMNVFRSTMVEAVDTLGGYLVPVDFQMRLLERVAGLSVIRGRASQMNTNRDRVEFPEATGASGKYTSPVRVTWVDETPTLGNIAEANVTFGMRGITVHTAMAETPISRNLVEDSAFDVEGYLIRKLSESAAIDENKQFATGTGVGKPQGMLPNSANFHALTEVNSGGASSLTWDGLIKVPFAVPAQYRGQGSSWLMNKATLQAIALIKDNNFGYLLHPYQYQGGENSPIGTSLLGYPVLEDEDMPDIASGTFPILFGDFSAYQIVDRLGMTVERYLDASTARQNLIYYVMRRRLGGQLVETWRVVVQKCST